MLRSAATAAHRGRLARSASALAAGMTALVILYLVLVPRQLWPGLLPSHGALNAIPPLAGSPHAHVHSLVHELYANFTRVYSAHDSSPPPEPVYRGPWLTAAQEKRYNHLRRARTGGYAPKYMLTTITRNIASQLPDLLNTIAIVTSYLGPDRVTLSIIEGPSDDTTPKILEEVLRPLLAHLGVPSSAVRIVTDAPKIDFGQVNRIGALAQLRNDALEPLWKDVESRAGDSPSTVGVGVGAVVFFNDVYLHASDVLELLHQHFVAGEGNKGTGVTAAFDWMTRDPAYYYDVWVGRTIDSGDLFYPINGEEWQPSSDLFHNSSSSRSAFDNLEPFQVYSAWNAMVVLNPKPFLYPFKVRFRRGYAGECAASECQIVCTDFWKHGWGRVQVVPSVQLAYDRTTAMQTASMLRETERLLKWKNGVPAGDKDTTVSWVKEPPRSVRCNAWPEVHGLSGNVWANTTWLPPYTFGY